MSLTLQQTKTFAREQLDRAKTFARRIQFVEKGLVNNQWTKEAMSIRASIGDDPDFADLEYGNGISAWTSILSIDLRDSTKLADQITARDMYLMIHTLLPTLAFVCENSEGEVMNFRGDGLFAGFGLKKISDAASEPTRFQKKEANKDAVVCGLRLIEAVSNAVEVVLEEDGVDVDLHAGVGIDCGHVTVTRVGWMSAGELTAYGSCVNEACHLSNARDEVIVSSRIEGLYPSGPGGILKFDNNGGNGFAARYGQSLLS